MSKKELMKWKRDCDERLKRAIMEGDEQAIDDIMEEIAYVKAELEE